MVGTRQNFNKHMRNSHKKKLNGTEQLKGEGQQNLLNEREKITLMNTKSRYEIIKIIGAGGQAEVYDCKKLTNHNKLRNQNSFAMKVFLRTQASKYLETYGFIPRSQNILTYHEFSQIEKNEEVYQVVITEKCEMTLEHLLDKAKKLKSQVALKILKQVLQGYMSLINYGIVHRDLKPSNILWKDKYWKIGDFGLARFYIDEKMTKVGTNEYQSPELFEDKKYTSKCDVYSLGVMIFEMLYGEKPQRQPNGTTDFKNKKLRNELKDFIDKCLEKTEKDRLSWIEIYKHSIFNDYFKAYVKQLEMIEELNKLQNAVLSFISDKMGKKNNEMRQEIINNQINLEEFQRCFQASKKFSKMKLIIAYCLIQTKEINQEYQNQYSFVQEQIPQAQMAQNEHIACLLTFYLSQIHQPKEPTVFFKGKDIYFSDYLKILQQIDESICRKDVVKSFNLLKTNDRILHKDFMKLFQFNFLKQK